MEKAQRVNSIAKEISFIAIFTAIIAVCSWISVPVMVPPFTLQTMGVFLAVGMLGGKRGTISVAVYLLMGAIGIPVFAGFNGGFGVILGPTGGYIVGFLFSALVMWLMERLFPKKWWMLLISMVVGLIVCYAFGTAWFMVVYTRTKGSISLWSALMSCVIPFIIPDLVKIAIALLLSTRLSKFIKF